MKIKDIIREDVDMSWWRDVDSNYNPEANKYVDQQEKRSDLLTGDSDGTPVFTKPVRDAQPKFSNEPSENSIPSPGYVGHKDVQVRAKHISKEKAREITGLDHPRSANLPAKDPYAP